MLPPNTLLISQPVEGAANSGRPVLESFMTPSLPGILGLAKGWPN
jgi:hypothetical protein